MTVKFMKPEAKTVKRKHVKRTKADNAKAMGLRPCGCGIKGRHRKGCGEAGEVKEDGEGKSKAWVCTECDTTSKEMGKLPPDRECSCGSKTFVQRQ
jgi:hypothetical protein